MILKRDETVTLSGETLHTLSNHFAVIVGFVDVMLCECADDDRRKADLLEIRRAAAAAARLLGRPLDPEKP